MIGTKKPTFEDKCRICDLLGINVDKVGEVVAFVRECKAAQLKADAEDEAATLAPDTCSSESDDDLAEAAAPEATVDVHGTTASDMNDVMVHPDGTVTIVVGNNVVAIDAHGHLLGMLVYM
jgi:hypothetical protein